MTQDRSHEQEARARWGGTPAWKESARRTRRYTAADWETIRGRQDAIEAGLAAAMEAGEAPGSDRAVELAEAARAHVDRWFYPCPPSMHLALSELYLSDPRFRAHYEGRAEGLTEFMVAAIRANAARTG